MDKLRSALSDPDTGRPCLGNTHFDRAQFTSSADFRGAEIRGDAYFNKAIIRKDADFDVSVIRGDAMLMGAVIGRDGVVTLLGAWAPDGAFGCGSLRRDPGSARGWPADVLGDLVPDGEADGHLGSVVGGGHQVAVGSEVG
ncbi:pentapeptide repeat-containing protein [Streptomyces sp. NPDC048411]|uniref:pentapeptide repeat-containing protein n=1 Tax=Streptomyces sp. NPDC048411 TaxID=3157206 RepID=UPI0034525321